MSRWTLLLVGLVATLALLAAACGTAEEDEDTPVPEEPTATAIVITGSAADTPEPETGDDMDDEDDMTMDENASVSGIPLDPDAQYGGTLQISYTSHSPSFVPWESAAGHSFEWRKMINTLLIKSRRGSAGEDFQNFAYFRSPLTPAAMAQSPPAEAYTFNLRTAWMSDGCRSRVTTSRRFDTIRLARSRFDKRATKDPLWQPLNSSPR